MQKEMNKEIDAEKILCKVRSLLSLAGNNPERSEALSALAKAQKLMAQYNLDWEKIEDVKKPEVEVFETDSRTRMGFRYNLSTVIGDGFACKIAWRKKRKIVIFYGRMGAARSAAETYRFAVRTVERLGRKYEAKYRCRYGAANGVFTAYADGFVSGVKEHYESVCRSLAVVVPDFVIDYYEKDVSGSFAPRTSRGTDKLARVAGHTAGRAFMSGNALAD